MAKKFATLDTVLLVGIIVIYIPLSLWGGANHWAGDTDALPFIMLGIGAVYVVYESIRLCSPAICPMLGALVGLLTIGPSLLLYPRDAESLPVVVIVGYLCGLMASGICWLRGEKRKVPISEWSFWLAIHSIFVSVLAVPAVVCGHIALGRLPLSEEKQRGRARTGLVVGYIVFAVMILGFVILAANA